MSVFGVVAEFNPFHKGHKYLIDRAKECGASAVVSVMSGNATQRGELAVCDKYYRAEAAIRNGVDLVLELPYPFSSASAEFFARGAVTVLADFCDTVIFGSECGDIGILRQASAFAASEDFRVRYKELLRDGEQSAAAYVELIKNEIGVDLSSNDILGVEYIKADMLLNTSLSFMTVKRQGSEYLCDVERDDGAPDSAMAIRKILREGNISALKTRLPSSAYEVFSSAYDKGELIDEKKYFEAARLYFRLSSPSELSSTAGLEGGIAERICRIAHESASGEEFFSQLPTKRYTDAKLRRGLLFAMTGADADDLSATPSYTLLLGADARGRELLSNKRKSDTINVITKPADASSLTDSAAKRQTELSARLDAIYTYCLERSLPSGELIRKKPYIT